MAEIKLETDEIHTLAKQMINASEAFSKRNDKIGSYAAELTVNCAFARLGRIYDMIQEASAAGSKRASELKELADKASKIQSDFMKADDDGASIKAPSPEDDIQLGLSQMAEYLPFVNVINDASIAFTGKDIGGVGKDPDEIQKSKVWTMVNAGTLGLGGFGEDVFERGMKYEAEDKDVKSYLGDLMSPEEAARYSEHWRKLGIGSDKTWKAFSKANTDKTIDDYFELVNGMSPWPIGHTGTPNVLKAGDRFYMAVENNAPRSSIGGFGVKEEIPSTQFIRENLAVKSNWKETCNKIRKFQVNDGVTLNVLEGPVGPQIDLSIDTYLPGDRSITQYDLFSRIGRDINRGDYVHIVDEFWVD